MVGNKCDLVAERSVSTQEGLEMARHFNIPFFETSARDGLNVEQALLTLIKNVMVMVSDKNYKAAYSSFTHQLGSVKEDKPKKSCF